MIFPHGSAELGKLTNLRYLNLGVNSLFGPIPRELGSLTDLRELRLHANFLSGPIPPELGGLANLTELESFCGSPVTPR